jgi:hypothetical protein
LARRQRAATRARLNSRNNYSIKNEGGSVG